MSTFLGAVPTSSSTSLVPSTSSRPSSSATSDSSNGTSSFYKNLFYILIGLLCAFGLVSFISLLRARRRRAAIIREATRLGVLVPGLPGYIPMRDRMSMKWTRADGSETPDWWEIERQPKALPTTTTSSTGRPAAPAFASAAVPASTSMYLPTLLDEPFNPLALLPPIEKDTPHEPPPVSDIPYFPNHLAYRPESLLPPPSRFNTNDMTTLDGLDGEHVEVLTIIQMPTEAWPHARPVHEEEEVIKEWTGIEVGVMRIDVRNDRS